MCACVCGCVCVCVCVHALSESHCVRDFFFDFFFLNGPTVLCTGTRWCGQSSGWTR